MNDELIQLNQKLDVILTKIEEQEKRLDAIKELDANLSPIKLLAVGFEQQREMMCEVSDTSMAFLARRLYEKSNMLVRALDRLEAVMDLVDEVEFLGKQVFTQAIDYLESLEKAGYFHIASEGGKVITAALNEVKPEDVQRLGSTVVPMIKAAREVPSDKEISLFALVKTLFDPKVRKGLVRMLNILKVLGQ